jgi:hypothetical protein
MIDNARCRDLLRRREYAPVKSRYRKMRSPEPAGSTTGSKLFTFVPTQYRSQGAERRSILGITCGYCLSMGPANHIRTFKRVSLSRARRFLRMASGSVHLRSVGHRGRVRSTISTERHDDENLDWGCRLSKLEPRWATHPLLRRSRTSPR